MSKPEFDQNDQDKASMFDFLSEDTDGQSTRRSAARKSQRKVMPVIRKPVPISKSGPLLPPKPGDPVEPPPPLTTGVVKETVAVGKKARISDDLDFLDETRAEVPDLRPAKKSESRPNKPDNVRPLHKNSPNDEQRQLEKEFQHLDSPRKKANDFGFDADWRAGHAAFEDVLEDDSRGWLRWVLLSAALLILAGGGFYAYTAGLVNDLLPSAESEFEQTSNGIALQPTDATTNTSELSLPGSAANLTTEPGSDSSTAMVESSMSVRFRNQLTAIESMVENGLLDDAEQALANMDRSVYGYGAVEFSALENQLASVRAGEGQERIALELAEAERVEQLRIANEAALAAEQLKQDALDAEAAAIETARLEQVQLEAEKARLAQAKSDEENAAQEKINEEKAAKAEAEKAAGLERLEQARLLRLKELEATKLLELQRLAQAASREQQLTAESTDASPAIETNQNTDSVAQVELATEIAARNAEKIRLDALEEAAREEARRQITAADRLATDRRIAEERAAADRQASKDARIERARQIEAQNASAKAQSSSVGSRVVTSNQQPALPQARAQSQNNESNTQELVISQTLPISDDELQTVYIRFTELQSAISNRDISKVVDLTERSGLRVQQFMQVFENSVGIDVRIRNVSTSNATGEIKGTLQIKSIKRADGTLAAPPADLESIRVTTKRVGDDWSVIRW
ncbi:hypothetical protein N9850_00510 [Granulosicoccus sp.]|nr:hypothetical protein [Granulosicoccus sp.]MDB4222224.1 hypothetical protein [Granulosicoccus sp.]